MAIYRAAHMPHLRFAMEQHHQAVDALFKRDAVALRSAIENDILRAQKMLITILQK